jgi:alcohol dehydrogenase
MDHPDATRGTAHDDAPDDLLGLRKFVAPEIVFGAGARGMAGRYARNLGATTVLVVTDPGVAAAGWTGEVTRSLDAEGVRYVVFADVSPNPRAAEVMEGAQAYRDAGCNAIVAVGGGSPMDCAKGIGIVSTNDAHVLGFEGVDEVPLPGPPLVCVPTTAGSSADVSQFAIITAPERRAKVAIVSKSVVPDVALIDPETTQTTDARVTAASGMDALTHAIEAYVSNAHSPLTDLHALTGMRLVVENLVAAVHHPADIETRGRMMLGSLHAGLAFSNASLGAVHAMAHNLGGLLDIPHGDANAMLLTAVIDFNWDAAPQRYGRVARAIHAGDGGKEALVAAITRLRAEAGIAGTLRDAGVLPEHIPALAANAILDACMVTNPRVPSQGDIEAIYAAAL